MINYDRIVRVTLDPDTDKDAIAQTVATSAAALIAEVIQGLASAVVAADETDIDLRIVKANGFNSAEYHIRIMNVSARMDVPSGGY